MEAVGQRQIAMMIAAESGRAGWDGGEHVGAMTALLRLGAIDGARSDPDGALVPEEAHPGYLTREIGSAKVFVPYNLAPVCPGSDILREVIGLSGQVRLGAANPICISGSTTFLGALKVIADLDFCEYYLLPASGAAAELAAASSNPELPLVWAKFGSKKYVQPWNCLSEVGASFASAPGRLKLDFMSSGALGPMPTTNVILPTSDGEDGRACDSFAYQEVVIGSDGPPRALVAPNRFGAYLRFLTANAREHVEDSGDNPQYAIKALKRILALVAALGDRARVETITETLNRPEIEEVVRKVRIQELDAMRADLPEPASSRFGQQIDDLRNGADLITQEDVQEALFLARELATSLIEEAESELAEYA